MLTRPEVSPFIADILVNDLFRLPSQKFGTNDPLLIADFSWRMLLRLQARGILDAHAAASFVAGRPGVDQELAELLVARAGDDLLAQALGGGGSSWR